MGCCTSLARTEKFVLLPDSVVVEARSKTEEGQVTNDADQERRACELMNGHSSNEGGGDLSLSSHEVKLRGAPAHGAAASSKDRRQMKVDLSSKHTNDGCDQVLCGLNHVVLVMSCNSCQNHNIPQMLRVESPHGQHSCVGLYVIVPEELPHGFPCWRLTPNGSRWLYSTKSGIWCIGGDDVSCDQFGRSAGFIFQGEVHKGKLPHEHHATWHRWDGTSFVIDNGITVATEELEVKPAVPAISIPVVGTGDQQSREISEASTAVPPGSAQPSQEFSTLGTELSQLSQEPSMVHEPSSSSSRELMNSEPAEERMSLDVERRWHPGMQKLGEPKTSIGFGLGQPWSLNCWHVQSEDTEHYRLLPRDSIEGPASDSQQSCRPRPKSSKRSKRLSRQASGVHPSSSSSPRSPRSPIDKGAFPLVLCIESPNVHTSCAGFYVLVAGARPNGRPLWKKRGARRWLYTGTDGKWYVGGPSSSKRKFKCDSGYLCHHGDQAGGRPDRLQGPWSWGDAEAWYPDADIVVRFAENFEFRPVTDRIET